MRSFTTGSILITKLLTLLCFTNMGLMSMNLDAAAMAPCHEVEITNQTAKDCNVCVIALNSWSESYVETSKIEMPEIVFAIFDDTNFTQFSKILTASRQSVYRPPPQVVLANAFHHPQSFTVIIV